MDRWLTIAEVTEATGISEQVVRVACKRRQLPGEQRSRRQWYVREDRIAEWIAERARRLREYWALRKARGSDAISVGRAPWEIEEHRARAALLQAAYRGTPDEARAALATLRDTPYRVTLPLVERRLAGIGGDHV